jgi:two-component sensor histidine kinase/tetratricopeptide (TPR) repeat protein
LVFAASQIFGQKNDISKLKLQLSTSQDLSLQYDIHKKLGVLYQSNKPDSAIFHFYQAQALAEQLQSSDLQGDINYSLGVFERVKGNFNKSIEYAIKAASFFELSEDDVGLIEVYTLLGHNYALKKDYEKSLLYYDKSDLLCKKTGNQTLLVPTYIGKGNVLYFQDDLDQASILFEKAIEISEKYNSLDVTRKAGLYNNTGNIYLTQERYYDAIEKYQKAFDAYFLLNDKFNMSLTSFNLGDAYLGVNNYDSSLKYCNINLFLANQLESQEEIKYAYQGLTNLYEQQGLMDSAFKYYQLYVSYNDSLKDQQYDLQVDELVTKYDNEKQAKELQTAVDKVERAIIVQNQSDRLIYLLIIGGAVLLAVLILVYWLYRRSQKANALVREQSDLISSKNKSIDKALFQKDILLKEVHHRVKNNLQIIASLLNLQTMKTENKIAKQAIEDSKSRVQAIALMHKSLYQDEQLNKVNLKAYIDDLVDNQKLLIQNEKREIEFELAIDEITVSIDDAVPLGLIISELISNSIKHAFNTELEEPKICVDLKRVDGQLTLVYSDNGVGVDDEFNLFAGSSLGYEIITALTDQLEGEIQLLGKRPFKIELKF